MLFERGDGDRRNLDEFGPGGVPIFPVLGPAVNERSLILGQFRFQDDGPRSQFVATGALFHRAPRGHITLPKVRCWDEYWSVLLVLELALPQDGLKDRGDSLGYADGQPVCWGLDCQHDFLRQFAHVVHAMPP